MALVLVDEINFTSLFLLLNGIYKSEKKNDAKNDAMAAKMAKPVRTSGACVYGVLTPHERA